MKRAFQILFIVGLIVLWRRCAVAPYGYSMIECEVKRRCGSVITIDCDAAADGKLDYVNAWNRKLLAQCGGVCMHRPCNNCPPKEWVCR